MSQEDSGQEKNFDPTPQKIEQARKKGDLVKSNDVNVAMAYLGMFLAVSMAAGWSMVTLGDALVVFLASPDILFDKLLGKGGPAISAEIIRKAFLAVMPFFLLPALGVLLSLLTQRGIVFAPSKIAPKLSKISIISNAKQKYGPQGLVEFLKTFSKLCLIGVILAVILMGQEEDFAAMIAGDAKALPSMLQVQAAALIGGALGISIIIAAADYMWQVHSHKKKLMMSFQDIKDESKNTEGDPHMKQTRQQRGREIAMNRMMSDVPLADVIIVNPTHYAVALKWKRKKGHAPKCVAKGVDRVAMRIREIAVESGVPIHSDPPATRAVYASTELGEEIDETHFQAVAAAIRFADSMRAKKKSRGF